MEIGAPDLLFTLPAGVGSKIEPHPDGKRFITARNLPNKYIPEQVCVNLNWFDELKAKVPVSPR